MREHVEAGLRGFNARYQTMEDGSWFTTQYVRAAGFGAWNRVGAVVQRVGNGTYAIPTNFTSPMP
jgi:hypothetical protein